MLVGNQLEKMEMVKFESHWLELLGTGMFDPTELKTLLSKYGENKCNE